VIRQVVEDGLRAGLPISYMDGPDAVRQVVPALSPDICGASFCATDGHANNHLTVRAYAQAATRHGATIRTGVHVEALQVAGNRVTGVVTNEGVIEAGVVIVAAGIYTPRLLTPLELDYRITVTHCPVVQTEETRPMLGPVLGVASGGFAGRQEASGRLRLIGQVEEWTGDQHTADNTAITFAQAQDTINQSLAVLPAIASLRISKMWGGLIDRTPDVIPVLDRVPQYDGLVVGAGFSGHGFGIGPITGEILADLAVSGTSRFDLTPFALARFANAGNREDALQMHG
jgi:sarcosine oxidase subunit beta